MAIIARKISECSCAVCQDMCRHSPCFPTPADAQALIDAGYKDRLLVNFWSDPKNNNIPLPCIAPAQESNGCTFLQMGLCELHKSGLKPTEGKLAIHDLEDGGLRRAIVYSWLTEAGIKVLRQFAVEEQLIELIREVMAAINWTGGSLQNTNK